MKFIVNANLAIPGSSLTAEGLKFLIEKSEKGPFYPIEELKKRIDKWKRKSEK
ncbi:MAG: hypothetical protein HYU69_09055 [Bacteroidetes bacterium]|nr:hypothetical protein [Bacteroidota bacterium]